MSDWLVHTSQLLAAVVLAAVGGNLFLKSVVRIADALHVPQLLIATTLAAFATSSPEFTVSTVAAMSGATEIGIGDALGSNVVNLALVFGLALLARPVTCAFGRLRREFALALAVPVLTLVLGRDGTLGRLDGAVLLGLFGAWMASLVRSGWRDGRPQPAPAATLPAATGLAGAWVRLPAGILMLAMAGDLFVAGASNIAASMGVHPYVIGATVVAVGTSLPELVTALLARFSRHDDIAFGTLLGSNLFNGLAIVGTATAIHPARHDTAGLAIAVGFGVTTVLLVVPRRGCLGRWRAVLLLATYVAYVAAMVT